MSSHHSVWLNFSVYSGKLNAVFLNKLHFLDFTCNIFYSLELERENKGSPNFFILYYAQTLGSEALVYSVKYCAGSTEKPWCQSGADIPTGLGINIGDTALGNPLRQQPSAYCGGGGGGGGRLDRTALWAGTHSCYHFADIFHAGWDDHKPLLLHSVTGSAKAKRDEERLRTVPARVFGCAPRRSVEVLHLSLESRPRHV